MRGNQHRETRFVLDPAVIACEVMHHGNRPVLAAFRDGEIKPVISRQILNHTLGFLSAIGLPKDVLVIWALWLSRHEKVHIVKSNTARQPICEVYLDPCIDGDASAIVTSRPDDFLHCSQSSDVTFLSPTAAVQAARGVPSCLAD